MRKSKEKNVANAAIALPIVKEPQSQLDDSGLRSRLAGFLTQDIVIGVVGYAGSGTTFTVDKFRHILKADGIDAEVIKARKILESWAESMGYESPSVENDVARRVEGYQNLGDRLRRESGEYGAVAGCMTNEVHKLRQNKEYSKRCVYFLDSLKHPAEVELLRQVYGEGFRLIGVGCRPDVRQRRLETKFHASKDDPVIKQLIERDAEDSENNFGQQVIKTFHLSDYFIDNTISYENDKDFRLADVLKEVFEKLFTRKIYHPSRDEKGLYFADAASMGSACLSRQVGAAIVDNGGNLLAVGRNDVPRANGGLYSDLDGEPDDGQCHLRGECSNKVYQDQIVEEILSIFDGDGMPSLGDHVDDLRRALRRTRMGSLIEFSRSVHAEMDALISLGRTGTQLPPGSVLYTTTYPCHNCARHIVASGITSLLEGEKSLQLSRILRAEFCLLE